jgi:hypothetical protein
MPEPDESNQRPGNVPAAGQLEEKYDGLREWANGYREAEGMDQHRRALVLSLLADYERLLATAARNGCTHASSARPSWYMRNA